tara:strand:+ start:4241 stop:5173 length:933 start_codon:yes stop_codon:yes gene_type:complete
MADFDIFNLSVSDVETHEAKSNSIEDILYKPTADDGKDGTYKALIRFVPNPENPRNSLVRKYVHWLTDPSGSGRLVDSPASVGEKCVIQDAFFRLRKSDSAIDRKMSEKLKRREQYYALIKIVKDPQRPETEGQYRIFKFGYKIKEKIDEELSPAFGEPTQIFDLFEGKNFELIITRQGEYNNYDKSKFSASKSAIMVGDSPAERSQEAMSSIKTELDAAPKLANYDYKAWDDATRDFVNTVLGQYISNPAQSMSNVTAKPSAPAAKVNARVEQGTSSLEEAFDVATPAATTSTVSDDDDLDSFLNDLDI